MTVRKRIGEDTFIATVQEGGRISLNEGIRDFLDLAPGDVVKLVRKENPKQVTLVKMELVEAE